MTTATATLTNLDGAATLTVCGDVSADASEVAAVFATLAASEPSAVMVDICGVTGLGMPGVGLLFGLYRSLPWGVQMSLRVSRGPVASLLGLLRMVQAMPVEIVG